MALLMMELSSPTAFVECISVTPVWLGIARPRLPVDDEASFLDLGFPVVDVGHSSWDRYYLREVEANHVMPNALSCLPRPSRSPGMRGGLVTLAW